MKEESDDTKPVQADLLGGYHNKPTSSFGRPRLTSRPIFRQVIRAATKLERTSGFGGAMTCSMRATFILSRRLFDNPFILR
jgi:hypothetical protein